MYGEIHTYYFKIDVLSILVKIKLKSIINDKIIARFLRKFFSYPSGKQ